MISYNAIRKNKTLSQVLGTGEAPEAESKSKNAAANPAFAGLHSRLLPTRATIPAENDKKD